MRTAVWMCSLLALTAGCHLRRRGDARPAVTQWFVRPVDGPVVRVEGAVAFRGAMRADANGHAVGPVPATGFAASARMTDGTWRFVTDDGTVYRAPTALGALTVLSALPTRALSLRDGELGLRGVHNHGALAVIDEQLRAWAVDGAGASRTLPLERVLSVCFAGPDDVLAVTEPGVLHRSHDGGRTFALLRAPAGVPIAVWLDDDDGARVRTTAGTWRLSGDVLVNAANEGPVEALGRVLPATLAALDRGTARAAGPLTSRHVALDGRRVASLDGDRLVIASLRRGTTLGELPLPGAACELHRAWRGVRLVCRHEGWARFVTALDFDRDEPVTLRDEARAEPLGPVVFDTTSRAWAVQAPCTQQTLPDPRAVCLYDREGHPHALRLPLDADLVAMRDGVAWAHPPAPQGAPALVALSVEGVRLVPMPAGATVPVQVSASAAGVLATWLDADGHAQTARREGDGWRAEALPTGATRAMLGHDGTALAWGRDASTLALWNGRGGFRAPSGLVEGDASLVALDPDASSRCEGPWCRFGGAITVGPGVRAVAVRTRPQAVPSQVVDEQAQREVRCEHGAVGRGREIDHGAAASGYAVRATQTGAAITVTWEGATLTGTVTRTLPVRAGAQLSVRGVQGATTPAALVERCNATGCDHVLATSAGFTDLGLGRARGGGVEVLRGAQGWIARADSVVDGVTLATLVAVSPAGAVVARRTVALASGRDRAHVGSWEGADGLWVRDRGGRLRFVALDATREGATVTVPAPDGETAPCGASVPARGEVHMAERVAQVRGPGWFVEAGEWQLDEVLAVDEQRVCARGISGGEARPEDEAREAGREEREPVRSFVLRAEGAGFVGTAWSGERSIALRCAR